MRYLLALVAAVLAAQTPDPRQIATGRIIPDEGYSDQPYIAKTDDGAWLCVITTGPGKEGAGGQHVVTRRSTDQGRTWSAAVDVEPSNGPEASYAVLLKVPGGRVYVFYNHNTDNVRQVIGDRPAYPDGWVRRVDSLGHFVFKYSDDHGRSWSARRFDVPQRDFAIDRANPYGGKLKYFWNVGKAFVFQGAGYVPLHKVGGFGEGFFTSSEGVLLRSPNILTERDPSKIRWETLPEGDVGIRAPAGGGPIAEEQSFSVLSDGSLFCVYRTIDGHPAATYSRDGGRHWEAPDYLRYADGRPVKHPRAANFAWRCENGKFLYWFHNHGGRFIRESPRRRTMAYEDRNPVWLSGGVEADGPTGKVIRWSQPEIALYDDDPMVRMSYPDLVEDGGRYYLTETQKDVARVHEIDRTVIEGLWQQSERGVPPPKDFVLEVTGDAAMPSMPEFYRRSSGLDGAKEDLRAGFSLDVWLDGSPIGVGQVLVDSRTIDGKGFALVGAEGNAVELVLNDGRTESRWKSEAVIARHVVAIVDGGPKIAMFVTDGRLNDGGDERQFGWGRINPNYRGPAGGETLRVGRGVQRVRVYRRALRISEAVSAYRAGI